ncbi:hypothetical protein, partial [Shigella dysenteriae]|uniref:hypothetical protein n=1 Tax=Shigella dysenteriae TaxID=622 RepID=UPI001CC1EFA4
QDGSGFSIHYAVIIFLPEMKPEKRGQAPYIRHPSPHQKYCIHRSSAVTRYQPYPECPAIQKINI